MKISVVQMSSTADELANLQQVSKYLSKVQNSDCDLVVLPENVLCHGTNEQIRSIAKTEAEWLDILKPYSINNSLNVVWGGIPIRQGDRLFNTALVIDHTGRNIAKYAKKHLFFAKGIANETDLYNPGDAQTEFIFSGWKISLSICFDIRFPEHYHQPDLILCPAAFSQSTGQDHWELLCRARAVENQCFLVAANQYTVNKCPFPTFGHSMIVNPWGDIMKIIKTGDGIISSELDINKICEVREKMPMERKK